MTYRVLHGKTRDTMVNEMLYDTIKPARAAFYAMEFDRWAALMEGDVVIMDNMASGPVVKSEECEQ